MLDQQVATGGVRLVIGTHALLFAKGYSKLGLVIIDEQHK